MYGEKSFLREKKYIYVFLYFAVFSLNIASQLGCWNLLIPLLLYKCMCKNSKSNWKFYTELSESRKEIVSQVNHLYFLQVFSLMWEEIHICICFFSVWIYFSILVFFCLLMVRHNSYDLFARFIESTSFLRQEDFELCYRRKKQKQENLQQQRQLRKKKSASFSITNKLVTFPKNPFQFKFAGKIFICLIFFSYVSSTNVCRNDSNISSPKFSLLPITSVIIIGEGAS